ncbi:hypothetical protein SDC9_160451 [bioreactor metagenome]|uniref:Uncharacterized protein n=1 Tax=bioreactor metagenome TaxID=1076179 RepID=A0A645FFI7_9ZZZZ
MQVEVPVGELGELGESAAQRQPLHRVAAQMLEHRPGEVAHVEQCLGGQAVEVADGPLRGGPGGGGDVLQPPGARHVDAEPDAVDPG